MRTRKRYKNGIADVKTDVPIAIVEDLTNKTLMK